VGWALMALAVGLVPFTIQYICLRAFYALEANRTTFFLQIVIAGSNVVIGIAVVLLLDRPSLVATGLALAYSGAYILGVLLSFRVLRRTLPELSGAELARHSVRLLVAVAPAGVVAALISWAVGLWSDAPGAKVLGLGLAGLAALGIFVVLARALHIREVDQIVATVLRRGRGGSGGPGAGPPPAPGPSPDEPGPTGDSPSLIESLSPTIDSARVARGTPATGDRYENTELAELDVNQPGSTRTPPRTDVLSDSSDGDPRADAPHRADRLCAGTLLAHRYRLEELLADSETTLTWRAFDQVLSRSVLIHLLPPDDPRAPELLDAARRAAVATDSRFLRVLDAVLSDDPDIGSYIVCEYAVGQSLEFILSHGPLSGLEAGWVVREVADALSGVHALGLFHQRIDPDTIIITPTGNVKIVGLLIESTLRPKRDDPVHGATSPEHVDVLDLGRLLYATLVARWPGGPAFSLPDAPSIGHRWMTPRQVRAGVSPALDQVCDQILGNPPRHRVALIETANDVVNALTKVLGPADASGDLERRLRQPIPTVPAQPQPVSSLLDQPTERSAAAELPAARSPSAARHTGPMTTSQSWTDTREADTPTVIRKPSPPQPPVKGPHSANRRRWLVFLVALVVLLLAGSAVWAIVHRSPGTGGAAANDPSTSAPTAPASIPSQPITIDSMRDFDPQGGDQTENPDEVAYAYDGDPDTRWRTVRYIGNPKLGGIKRGVGLVVDLGTTQPVSTVTVTLSGNGTTVQARVPKGDAATITQPPMSTDRRWRTVVEQKSARNTATLTFPDTVSTRFVLVYLTSLPKEGDGYRGGIFEVEVLQ